MTYISGIAYWRPFLQTNNRLRRGSSLFLSAFLAIAGCAALLGAPPVATASVLASSGTAIAQEPVLSPPAPLPAGTYCEGPDADQPPGSPAKVMLVMLENNSYKKVIGSTNAPFESILSKQCGSATAAFGATHWSAANYLAISAAEFPPNSPNGCGNVKACTDSSANLFAQLDTADLTWQAFMEAMPGACATSSSGNYKIGHNPPIFYPTIAPSQCRANDVGVADLTSTTGSFASSVAAGTLPNLSFVSPSLAYDGEGSGGGTAGLRSADLHLQRMLTLVQQGPDYENGNLDVFIAYDEGSGADATSGEDCTNQRLDLPITNDLSAHQESCHVPLLLLNRYASAAPDPTFFDHYSITRTIEQLFGLPYLAHAGDAQTNSLLGHFGLH
jgi:hypothetical protein